jgi:hypothetical protein
MSKDAPFPVHPRLTVIEGRTLYKKDFKRWVALCAIKDDHNYIDLKLYEWEWRAAKQEWKVSFANYSIKYLDLARLLRDATELAAKHSISLEWFDPPQSSGHDRRPADTVTDLLNYVDRNRK